MNETLKQIGMQLKRFFSGEVRRPLNWRMIDAIETLREAEPKEDETNAEIERGARLEDDQSNVTDIALRLIAAGAPSSCRPQAAMSSGRRAR